jgi:hypothetical protein
MKTVHCEIDDHVARILADAAAERGVDEPTLLAEIVNRFARRRTHRRQVQGTQPPVDAASDEEDRQLAELGMDDYAAGLAAEDEA